MIIAIIPARGGSKRVPFKSIVDLAGRPLMAYTIKAAKESGIFDKIIVSTDNRRIAETAARYGAQVIKRPKRLAGDRTPTEPVMLHVLERLRKKEDYRPDIIFLLQPTSPLRNKDDIRAAHKRFMDEKLDSLLSVTRNTSFIWEKKKKSFRPINYNYHKRPRKQDFKNQFKEDGAIYIVKYSIFMKERNRLGGRIGYYLMDEYRSAEIDKPLDLLVAKQILRERSLR